MQIVSDQREKSPSPAIAKLPRTAKKRLIDKGLLHYEASAAGFAERYGRGETSHTIHVWWARRPHTAMRALIFASLCKKANGQANDHLGKIGLSASLSDQVINDARAFLSKQYKQAPRILDMFGGGGTIPFESLNLGAEAYAIDANELSVFIQRCNLIYSQKVPKENISNILESSGKRVLHQLEIETAPLYPLRQAEAAGSEKPVFGYLWTYSIKCGQCGYRYYLLKRPWLSKKKGRDLAFTVSNVDKQQLLSVSEVQIEYKYPSTWIGRKGCTQCPRCKHVEENVDIKNCIDELVALIKPGSTTGKDFVVAQNNALPPTNVIENKEKSALADLKAELPNSFLPMWSGIVNPALYGVETHADFLNQRQRAVLILLIKCLKDEYLRLCESENIDTARYIVSLLSSFIDQIVDWNCRLSMWISQNEQVGRGFCGPGISMLWDYVETDPVSTGPSNLWDKLKRIVKGSCSINTFPNKGIVRHAYAQNLPFENNYFDAIVTDPPYYDNIYYSALADFFFSWKRILLKQIEPDLFISESTDSNQELVASKYRNGNSKKAHEEYCKQLHLAIKEAQRVLKDAGIFSFIYSHSSLHGWEALVRAYRPTSFIITSVQPLSIERKQRPRAMTSQAVNTCIAFVARKSASIKPSVSYESLRNKFLEICNSGFVSALEKSGWNKKDAAIAVYAHAVAMLANVKKIRDKSDCDSLIGLEELVKEMFSDFKVIKRNSL